ncbi:MAG: DoxX family protein [Solirubrobacterales bacterium]
MFVATLIVSVLLAALLAFAAVRKLSHRERVVQTYVRVGVPEDKLDYLAMILLAGAAGLILGLFWAPIGIAAAAGVVCYFLVAVALHLRADDAENLPTPLAIALIAAAALALRIASLS